MLYSILNSTTTLDIIDAPNQRQALLYWAEKEHHKVYSFHTIRTHCTKGSNKRPSIYAKKLGWIQATRYKKG